MTVNTHYQSMNTRGDLGRTVEESSDVVKVKMSLCTT
jgi:hypothetical protein